jgi:DHA2 family lincomycin resistance protein-like MFS transporter
MSSEGDLATVEPFTINELDKRLRYSILADRHLKKAPVMEGGKMVGIINRSNITKYSVGRYLAQADH